MQAMNLNIDCRSAQHSLQFQLLNGIPEHYNSFMVHSELKVYVPI